MTREQNDIVARLRKQSVGDYNALWWDEAADEIERLRAELVRKADELEKQYRWHHLATEAFSAEKEATLRELRKVETECSMLRVECGLLERNAETTYENHKRIVAELTAERDEARRENCRMAVDLYVDESLEDETLEDAARILAERNGWDCFKENKR